MRDQTLTYRGSSLLCRDPKHILEFSILENLIVLRHALVGKQILARIGGT